MRHLAATRALGTFPLFPGGHRRTNPTRCIAAFREVAALRRPPPGPPREHIAHTNREVATVPHPLPPTPSGGPFPPLALLPLRRYPVPRRPLQAPTDPRRSPCCSCHGRPPPGSRTTTLHLRPRPLPCSAGPARGPGGGPTFPTLPRRESIDFGLMLVSFGVTFGILPRRESIDFRLMLVALRVIFGTLRRRESIDLRLIVVSF